MEQHEKHFFSHAALISIFTASSRILGLLRDMACAAVFGGGMVWDAFSLAFRIPNLFRRIFGEGAMNAASMPVFTDYIENRSTPETVNLIRTVATALALVLTVLLAAGMFFFLGLPLLTDMGERWRLVFALSAVMLPYMLFICLSALAGSVLNSMRRFSVPAASPIVLNACWIAAVLFVAPIVSETPQEKIFVVAAGILIAGLLQVVLHLFALKRQGIAYRPVFNFRHPAVRKIFLNMAPVTLGMAAYQINSLLDGVIAVSLSAPAGKESFSFFGRTVFYPMQEGANSALYFADRLMQLPLGIFGIALATAIFPVFSSHAVKKDWGKFAGTLTDGLGAVILIALPAGAGLAITGRPAIALLFERGAFTSAMTSRTYIVLLAHTIGIWAYCGRHVLEKAFFSCNDQLSPVRVAAASIVLNICLNLTLIWVMAEAGLALATALSASAQTVVLYMLLAGKTAAPGGKRLLLTLAKAALSTAIMAAVCLAVMHLTPEAPAGSDLAGEFFRVSAAVISGAAVFAVCAKVLKIHEFGILCSMFSSGHKSKA